MKKIIIYSLPWSFLHIILASILIGKFDHGDVFIWSIYYTLGMISLASLLIFVFKKRTLGLSALLSFVLPIALLIFMQILVALSYQGYIP